MKILTVGTVLLFAGFHAVASNAPAHAQTFPTRVVKLVVPVTPRGGVDGVARLIAERLTKFWGQPVVVENRVGASGNIGNEYVVRSDPDGYTVLFAPSPVYTTSKLLHPKLPFDPDTDFKPVLLAAVTPNIIMVSPKIGIRTLPEFIEYARQNPGKVTYASQGIGTTGHLTMAYLSQVTKIDMRHIPYRGPTQAQTDVIAGNVMATVDVGLISVLGLIRGGSLHALAAASAKRSPALPNVPTAIEQGLPGFESESWYGAVVPSRTPDEIVRIIRDGMVRAFKEPDIYKSITERGANLVLSTPAKFTAYSRADSARWKQVIDAGDIKLPN